MGDGYYDRQGHAITLEDFAAKHGDSAYKFVAQVKVKSADCEISTVWLGSDHSIPGGPLEIFESLVFGGGFDQHQVRYATEAEALAGHQQLIEQVTEEAAAFRRLAANRKLHGAVLRVENALDTHRWRFGLSEYDDGSRYRRLVREMKR
jgi:hypothetical protein